MNAKDITTLVVFIVLAGGEPPLSMSAEELSGDPQSAREKGVSAEEIFGDPQSAREKGVPVEEFFDDPQVSYPEGRDTLIGTWRFSVILTEGKGGFTKTYQFFPATGVVLGGVDRDDGGQVTVTRSRPPPPLTISPFTFSMVDFSKTNQLGTPVCSVYDFNVVSQNQLYGAVLMYTGTEAGCRESPIESITHYILSAERIK